MSTDNGPSPRVWPELYSNGTDSIIVWGGRTSPYNDGKALKDGGVYDIEHDSWKKLEPPPSLPAPGAFDVKVMINGIFIAYGHYNGNSATGAILAPPYDRWEAMPKERAPVGVAYGSAIDQDQLIVWARPTHCHDDDQSTPLLVSILDTKTKQWQKVDTSSFPADASCMQVAKVGNRLVLWGGVRFRSAEESKDVAREGYAYDLETGQGEIISVSQQTPTWRSHPHLLDWHGDRMVVWGGQWQGKLENGRFVDGEVQVPADGGAIYDFATKEWTSVAKDGAPVPRHSKVHIVLDQGEDKLFIWGGVRLRNRDGNELGYRDLANGGLYNLRSHSWEPLSEAGAPSPRANEVQHVIAGRDILIWGGVSSDQGPFESGAFYDLGRKAWRPTAKAGAPKNVFGYGTAWLKDRQMFVWGGASDDDRKATNAGFVFVPDRP